MSFFTGSLFDTVDVSTKCTSGCSHCGKYIDCISPKLTPYKGTNDILLILPPVSEQEDVSGVVGVGEQNQWLADQFREIGIDWKACSKINVLGCKQKTIKPQAYQNCKGRLDDFIKEIKPKLILAFGEETLPLTVGVDWTRNLGDIQKWRGFLIPYRRWNNGIWLMHTYSPKEIVLQESFVRNEKWKNASTFADKAYAVRNNATYRIQYRLLLDDLKNAFKGYSKPIPPKPETLTKPAVLNEEEALEFLRRTYRYLKQNPNAPLVLDLETNALKPFDKDKRIYSMAVLANPDDVCGAFRFTDKIQFAMQKIAELNPRVIGANYSFDYLWGRVVGKYDLPRCVWDVCIVQHILDNRKGITSLKFCGLIYWGSIWEATVHSYLEPSAEDTEKRGTNAVNKIFDCPDEHAVLYYNSMDVILTYYCMQKQFELWKSFPAKNKWFAFKLFHKAIPVLAQVEINGLKISMDKVKEGINVCENALKELDAKIKDDPIWKEWGDFIGVEKRSILSDSQIVDFFIKHKHYFPKGISKRAKPCADLEWVSKMVDQCPFLQNVLDYRKYTKLLSTYLKGALLRETNDDGRLRPFFTLNNVTSYRMAANSPNFLNFVSREPVSVKMIKSCFIPDDNCYYVSHDYSGLENCGSAAICKDSYAESVIIGGHDMHKENALFMFCMTEEEFTALKEYDNANGTKLAKACRNAGKTASFSTLYGAGKETVATSIWKAMEEYDIHVTPTETAKKRIIRELKLEQKYSDYVKECERKKTLPLDKDEFFLTAYQEHAQDFLVDFWEVRMKATKDWKDRNMEHYFRTGYAEYPVGFIIHGSFTPMTINNAVVQGSSSCCTLYSLIVLDYLLKKFNYKAFLVNVIHDDINLIVDKSQLTEVLCLQKWVMEELTRLAFPWLTFNLKAECELSDKSWADKKEYNAHLEYYKEHKDEIGERVKKELNYTYKFEDWN